MPAVEPTAPPDDDELAQWLRLSHTCHIGVATGLRLLRHFGLPAAIFAASPAALAEQVGPRLAQALSTPPAAASASLTAATLAWRAQPGNHLLTLADPRYPQVLLEIPDPPLLLYAKGRIELLQRSCVAIVGSRNATMQGLRNAERFSDALGGAGFTVVSGMALGIDTAAHHGGLRHPASATIAVIGTGIDIVYPSRNRNLAYDIAAHGCMISEYPLGTSAIAGNFPRRNRLISGLARAVLVIEAAAQSGSLITARVAAEQGRDVFAIPGSIHAPLSKGCHHLIKQGAKLIDSLEDILDELGVATARGAAPASVPQTVSPLLDAMGFDPVDCDTLAARAGLDAAALTAQLLTLEIEGRVEILPGGNYRRVE